MDKRKKGHGELVIACSDPAKNLEFVEEALNQVAFLIIVEITKQVSYELLALRAIKIFSKDFNWSSVYIVSLQVVQ